MARDRPDLRAVGGTEADVLEQRAQALLRQVLDGTPEEAEMALGTLLRLWRRPTLAAVPDAEDPTST